ncbi:MAG: O-antigen ligase family protein [Acidobacteriota bacterium]
MQFNPPSRLIRVAAVLSALWVASVPLAVFHPLRVPVDGLRVPLQTFLLLPLLLLCGLMATRGGLALDAGTRRQRWVLGGLLLAMIPSALVAETAATWIAIAKMAAHFAGFLVLAALARFLRVRHLAAWYVAAATITLLASALWTLQQPGAVRLEAWRPHSANQLSFVLQPALLIALGWALRVNRRWLLPAFGLAGLFWLGILQTFSRGAWVSSIIGLSVLACFTLRRATLARWLAAAAILAIPAILVVPRSFLAPPPLEEVQEKARKARAKAPDKPPRLRDEKREVVLERRARRSLEARKQLVESSWHSIRERPWTGWGYRQELDIELYRDPTTPHNSYLALVIYHGIFALALALAFLAMLTATLARAAWLSQSSTQIVALACLASVLVRFLVADFFFASWGWGILSACGIAAYQPLDTAPEADAGKTA